MQCTKPLSSYATGKLYLILQSFARTAQDHVHHISKPLAINDVVWFLLGGESIEVQV